MLHVDQNFTLIGLLKPSWEPVHPVCMYLVDLENAWNCVPLGILWGTLEISSSGIFSICHIWNLFVIFMDRISSWRQGEENVWVGNP